MRGVTVFVKCALACAVLTAIYVGVEGTYLVTLEKKELIDVLMCVGKSKSPILCSKFASCERLMTPRVKIALDACKLEVVPEGLKRCTPYSAVFEKPEIPEKIFDCVIDKVEGLTLPEKKVQLNFEECTKVLFDEDCKGRH